MSKSLKNKELTVEDKFVNYLLKCGKKSTAIRIYEDMLLALEERGYKDSQQTLKKALENIYPIVEVRPKRIGGAVYQVPIEVIGKRRIALGLRWLLKAANARKGKPMSEKLADEIVQAIDSQGSAVKKKEDVHKMAEANKAFAHFARY